MIKYFNTFKDFSFDDYNYFVVGNSKYYIREYRIWLMIESPAQ